MKYNIFWDLGNTLLTVDSFLFARHIGLADITLYSLIERKHPQEIFIKALHALSIVSPSHEHVCGATALGTPLPFIVCEWLAGRVSLSDAHNFLKNNFEEQLPPDFFTSKREAKLVARLLQLLTDPFLYTTTIKLVRDGIILLEDCLRPTSLSKRHSLFILSNWDPYSFKTMSRAPHLQPLFTHFNEDQLIISGEKGMIKPHPEIYRYVLSTYQLDPRSCIVIDDQEENIIGAQQAGMHAILLKGNNYEALRGRLHTIGVLV